MLHELIISFKYFFMSNIKNEIINIIHFIIVGEIVNFSYYKTLFLVFSFELVNVQGFRISE